MEDVRASEEEIEEGGSTEASGNPCRIYKAMLSEL